MEAARATDSSFAAVSREPADSHELSRPPAPSPEFTPPESPFAESAPDGAVILPSPKPAPQAITAVAARGSSPDPRDGTGRIFIRSQRRIPLPACRTGGEAASPGPCLSGVPDARRECSAQAHRKNYRHHGPRFVIRARAASWTCAEMEELWRSNIAWLVSLR